MNELTSGSTPFRTDVIPGLLFLASLVLFATRLSVPADYMFDEVYHAYTAGQYVAGNTEAHVEPQILALQAELQRG